MTEETISSKRRRSRKKGETKTERVMIPTTPTEKAAIERGAKRTGQPMSRFILSAVTHYLNSEEFTADSDQYLKELSGK